MSKLEEKYIEHISQEKIKLSSETVDFIGINFDSATEKFGVKTYYTPESCINKKPLSENAIVKYTTQNDMNRFFWRVRDESSIREYIALKNRTNANIDGLFILLNENYDYIQKNMKEIKQMSQMSFTDKKSYEQAALYIIGVKGENNEQPCINFEWFTRYCPDPDDVGFEYTYKDAYFLDYLEAQNIFEYKKTIKFAKNLLNDFQKEDMHLWVIAADYFPDFSKKYKIYFKGSQCNILTYEVLNTYFKFSIEKKNILELDEFKRNHTELILYGFAICVDTSGKISLNSYYKFKN